MAGRTIRIGLSAGLVAAVSLVPHVAGSAGVAPSRGLAAPRALVGGADAAPLTSTRDGMVFRASDGTLALMPLTGGAGVRLTSTPVDVTAAWGCGSSLVVTTVTQSGQDWATSVLWLDSTTGQSIRQDMPASSRVVGASPTGYVISDATAGATLDVAGASGQRRVIAPRSDTYACDEKGYAWSQPRSTGSAEVANFRPWSNITATPVLLAESLTNLRVLRVDDNVALVSDSKRDGYTTRPSAVSLLRIPVGGAKTVLWSGTDVVLDEAITQGESTFIRVTDRTGSRPVVRVIARDPGGASNDLSVPSDLPTSFSPMRRASSGDVLMGVGGPSGGLYRITPAGVDQVAPWSVRGGTGFSTVAPYRLVDTRSSVGYGGILPAGQVLRMQIGAASGVPADARGVLLRVTTSGSTSAGFIRTQADGGPISGVGSIAFPLARGATVEYLTPLSETRVASLVASSTTHVTAEVVGYFTGTSTVVPSPSRALDTTTTGDTIDRLPPRGSVAVPLLGSYGMPSSGVESVVIGLTIRWPGVDGYATVYPDGTALPAASHLIYRRGESSSAVITVPLTAKGAIRVFSSADADVVVDVLGWQLSGSDQVTTSPLTILDTSTSTPMAAGETRRVQVTGVAGVPTTGVRAVRLMVLTSWPATAGQITVAPSGTGPYPSMWFDAGNKTLAYVTVPLAPDGSVAVTTNAKTSLLLRVSGYWRT